ncbi:MAG: hypothetical protein R2798_07120 [Chitinophagales bacterium]|nr:hypothetical protein [Bacteroidota bacterium]
MKKYFLGLFVISSFFACKSETKNEGTTTLNTAQAVWAKETNFKFDFTGEDEVQVSNIKADKELMDVILDKVQKGEESAYDYYSSEKLTPEQVANIFLKKEVITVVDPETGIEKEQEVENPLNRPEVKKFRIRQQWFFDEQNFSMQCKIIAIAPVEAIYNSDGSYRGDLPLFWVYFDEAAAATKPVAF